MARIAATAARLLAGVVVAAAIPATTNAAAPFDVIAHRGDQAVAPENTAPALRASAAAGFDVELDVWLTSDRVAVVIHDPTLDRMTDGTGIVERLTFQQVRAATIDVGANAGTLRLKVPTLWEALSSIKAAGGSSRILVEVKSQPDTTAKQDAIVSKVIQLGLWRRVTFMSWSHTALDRVRAWAATEYDWRPKTGLYYDVAPAMTDLARYDVASPQYELATPDYVAAVHAAGLAILPFTVDDEPTWARVHAAGVDGVLTDRAADVVAWEAAP